MKNQKPYYYRDANSKIADFAIGFLGLPLLGWICLGLITSLVTDSVWKIYLGLGIFAVASCAFFLLARDRRFINMGATASMPIIVLLMIGTCSMAINW